MSAAPPFPRVLVFASDVGAAQNVNPYCTPKEVALKIVQGMFPAAKLGVAAPADKKVQNVKRLAREAPVEIVTLAESMGLKTEAEALRGAQRRGGDASDTPEAAALAHAVVTTLSASGRSTTTAPSLAAAETAVAAKLGACSTKVKTEVMAAVKTSTYTSRGIRDEASGLTLFAAASGLKVAPGSGNFLSRLLFKGLAVGGKEDGLVGEDPSKPDAVVEVKRRQHKFFLDIPARELSQLYVYMYLHGVKTGYWVQLLDGVVEHRKVTWDDDKWSEVVEALRRFRALLQPFLLSEAHAEALLDAPDSLEGPAEK